MRRRSDFLCKSDLLKERIRIAENLNVLVVKLPKNKADTLFMAAHWVNFNFCSALQKQDMLACNNFLKYFYEILSSITSKLAVKNVRNRVANVAPPPEQSDSPDIESSPSGISPSPVTQSSTSPSQRAPTPKIDVKSPIDPNYRYLETPAISRNADSNWNMFSPTTPNPNVHLPKPVAEKPRPGSC